MIEIWTVYMLYHFVISYSLLSFFQLCSSQMKLFTLQICRFGRWLSFQALPGRIRATRITEVRLRACAQGVDVASLKVPRETASGLGHGMSSSAYKDNSCSRLQCVYIP